MTWHLPCWNSKYKGNMNTRYIVPFLVLVASWMHAESSPQMIDLEIGQSLDLRQFNGPNVNLTVNRIDISDVLVTLQDYSRMQGSGTGDAWLGSSASFGPT